MITETRMTRRRFLLVCGCVTAAVLTGCTDNESTLSTEDAITRATQPAMNTQNTATPTGVVPAAPPSPEPTAAPTPAARTRVTTRCPKGKVNDPYPGHCRLYTDANNNGLCDYSELS